MIERIIMFLCSIQYKKYKQPIFYIKGTEKQYPRYLLYTEDENVYKRMDKF
jgi:hypothetical protein